MPETQTTHTYTDPRYLDGDPFEVAAKAVRQATDAAALLQRALADANVMARNAEMERQLYRGEEPNAADWPESPQGIRLAEAERAAVQVRAQLQVLERAVGFNPRHPPKE